jgi:hypothetical protein
MSGPPRMVRGVPWRDVLRLTVTRVVPIGFAVGASMEAFMYFTGFWGVATRKAAERQTERQAALRDLRDGGHAGEGALASSAEAQQRWSAPAAAA